MYEGLHDAGPHPTNSSISHSACTWTDSNNFDHRTPKSLDMALHAFPPTSGPPSSVQNVNTKLPSSISVNRSDPQANSLDWALHGPLPLLLPELPVNVLDLDVDALEVCLIVIHLMRTVLDILDDHVRALQGHAKRETRVREAGYMGSPRIGGKIHLTAAAYLHVDLAKDESV